ncbi:MAG TPA: tetratricopeptide repeat protein [Ktedonobacterales bacterium]|nr:tetratricopeptide repeat protein [Ktedonobacterales bacterium]
MSADRITPLFGPSFASLLRRYREAAGLTQEQLAARAGLSARGISDLERGVRQAPRRETVSLLADALALAPHQRGLLEAAARPATDVARPKAVPTPPHNLPAQLTPPIGREREARLAVEALRHADTRLLTLTGPGGVGKTCLALAVAEEALDRFEDGVYAVMLAGLRDPALVMQAIADALGLRATADEPLAEQVRAFLRGRRMLLVLDNFEHLVAAAPAIAALLAAAPQLKALATSRERLKIGGEHELPVAPLADDAASELFMRRAQAARPDLRFSAAEQATVEAICQRVDRLPLAIELAASWVKVLPLPVLLERLNSRLELLTGGRRDAPERQRTLRDTIAWSELLLEPGERQLFRRLAVFAGGFTLDAAEAVCGDPVAVDASGGRPGAPASPDGAILTGMARLVEKSLLHAQPLAEGSRFTMLETIREYALEQLAASGEAAALGRRQAEYYARLAAELGWIGPDQDARDRRLERELPNLRAALAWARERRDPNTGLRLATPLGRWWYSRGAFDEGEGWLRELLALDTSADAEHKVPAALRVSALFALILFALDRRHYDEAEAMAREGLELARRDGDAARAGNMLAELGHVAEARGDLDAAMAYFEEALAESARGGQGAAIGRTLSSLGNLARAVGDHVRARTYLEQALAWAREREFSFAVASALVSLGHVAVEQDDYPRARELYREGLELYQTQRNPVSLAWCVAGVAATFDAQGGDAEAVARLYGIVVGLRRSAGAAESAEWQPFARAHGTSRRALGEDGFAAASAWGTALTPERAIRYALSLLDSATSRQT